VWAECIFVDPIADLAVLCEPDNQELSAEAEAYQRLIGEAVPFNLGRLRFTRPRGAAGPRQAVSGARMLSLDGDWFTCAIRSLGRSLLIEDATQPIRSGMTGSPIILPDGSAVCVVCISSGSSCADHREGGPNPLLFANLPAWLVREVL